MDEHFCVLPWVHLHPRADGRVTCCCNNNNGSLGDFKTQTITEIANLAEMKLVRSQMMNNIPVANCAGCKEEEAAGAASARTNSNYKWRELIPDLLEQTSADGKIGYEFKLRQMYIRHSNLCNFACRMCVPENSSKLKQELEGNAATAVIKMSDTVPNYMEQVYEQLPHVAYINFAGGEPMLIPEHWEILDELVRLGRKDIEISFFTNLSTLVHQQKNILDYVKYFPKFWFAASLDASHARAELFRYGTRWSKIEDNLKIVKDANIPIKINCTVSAMNIWHLADFHRYLLDKQFITPAVNYLQLANLTDPPFLSSKILPAKFKKEVTDKINDHCTWLAEHNIETEKWQIAVNFMNSEDNSHLLGQFIDFTHQTDQRRGENTAEVFPELKEILSGGG